jgi:N-alpha-acetyl-L-2,4-diaminobutyrate deacetylase
MSSFSRTMRTSPVTATVDYDADGVQHGFLRLPHSHDDSAWGALMIPITVIKNGGGPTALLTGGNHGDEYEGPLALFDLANSLATEAIKGRVIIIPAMNYPAFRAGLRTSPIDKGNLNRSFPGSPDGTITH